MGEDELELLRSIDARLQRIEAALFGEDDALDELQEAELGPGDLGEAFAVMREKSERAPALRARARGGS